MNFDLENNAWHKLRREIKPCFNCNSRPKEDLFEEDQRLYRGRCVDCWEEAGAIVYLEHHDYKGRPYTKWAVNPKEK